MSRINRFYLALSALRTSHGTAKTPRAPRRKQRGYISPIQVFLGALIFMLGSGCRNQPSTPALSPITPSTPQAMQTSSVPATPPSAAATPPHFVDITVAAGIHFNYQNSRTSRKYLLETFGPGVAFLDYDGDGWPDILIVNGAPLPGGKVTGRPTMALYHNNHNNTFTDVTHNAGLDKDVFYAMGIAVGDYDNDGREDFYVSWALGPGHLYHNEGNGHFEDVTAQAGVGNAGKWGTSCAWVDYDRDGKLDLFVCNYVKYASLADHRPCYAGEHKPVHCAPSAYDTVHCTLYHNEGNGRFTDATASSGVGRALGKSLGVTVWDYDEDGWPDIFVANDT